MNEAELIHENVYVGPSFSNIEIKTFLDSKNIRYKIFDDTTILQKTAQLIANGNVVGWYQGKMEWGARALGNRSILADARNPNIKDIINSKIKRRESFRPFAPAILAEHTEEWFEIDKEVPYMTEVYDIKENNQSQIERITFIGNESFSDKYLLSLINTKSRNFYNIFTSYHINNIAIPSDFKPYRYIKNF